MDKNEKEIIEKIAIIFATSTPNQDYTSLGWRGPSVKQNYMHRAKEAYEQILIEIANARLKQMGFY